MVEGFSVHSIQPWLVCLIWTGATVAEIGTIGCASKNTGCRNLQR